MNIVLIGFMGSGKTAVGKLLAEKLNRKFVDLDNEIEKEVGYRISEIFRRNGEKYFRETETKIIRLFTLLDNLVISTGGGAVLREENMKELRQNGVIIYLKTNPETILQRIKDARNRPLIKGKNEKEKLDGIKALLDFREKYYQNNDFTVSTDELGPEEISDEIIKKIGRK